MSIYSSDGGLPTGGDIDIKSKVSHDVVIDSQTGQNGSLGIPWVDSRDTPRINTYAFVVQGNSYYLPDGGAIVFFMHDKPMEFYGTEACLVRNRHVPGNYVIRVPSDTAVYRIADFQEMFEGRQKIAVRNARYIANSPYVHEREVGVNCGIPKLVSEVPAGIFGQGSSNSAAYALSNNDSHGGDNGYYYMPTTTPNFAVYPELANRVQTYLDTTISVVNSSPAGSDDSNADVGSLSSSVCPGSANELFTQRHANGHESGYTKFGYGNDQGEGYDLRVNSGGYGRIFPATDTTHNDRRYTSSGYKASGDPILNGSNSQHGSFIPIIPVRPVGDTPSSLPPRHLNKKTNALYKTEMCRNWNEIGECRYGRSCQFAHGKKELRTVPRHGQWKTKTCMAWLHGGCTYGSRCCYAHELIDERGHPQSPPSTEPGTSTNLGDTGESKFSEFFASRCWA